jgi:hypothetical protein
MTPLSFEWQWNIDHFIFMGLLYLALTVVGCGILYTWIKTWLDLSPDNGEGGESPQEISYRSRYSKY